jgi:primosomal protein N' (replication factor Y) (superfamily II helicase)
MTSPRRRRRSRRCWLPPASGATAVPAARRHRLRQDAGLHRAAARGGGAAGPRRHRARARDRAHAADGGALPAEFGDVVAVLHSALSDGERYDAWRALREGESRIAIGARSAIFAPVRDLGAIIVDEEHEGQLQAVGGAALPRPRGRRGARALWRARSACSAARRPRWRAGTTRSAASTAARAARARRRAAAAARPQVVDLRAERKRQRSTLAAAASRTGPLILSDLLVDAVHERLTAGEQTILLLNRRGYATFVQCRECGHVWHCPPATSRSPTTAAARGCLPLLPARGAGPRRGAPRAAPTTGVPRGRHRAGRAGGGRGLSRAPASPAWTWTPRPRSGRTTTSSSASARRGRHPARHADDRQGARLPQRHAGRRHQRRRRHEPAGLPRQRAHLPAPHPGRRPRRPRPQGRRGADPDGAALPLRHRAAPRARLRGFAARELAGAPRRSTRRTRAWPTWSSAAPTRSRCRTPHSTRPTGCSSLLARAGVAGSVTLTGPAPCAIDRIRGRWRWHFLLRSRSPAPSAASAASCSRYELARAGRSPHDHRPRSRQPAVQSALPAARCHKRCRHETVRRLTRNERSYCRWAEYRIIV